MDTQTFWTTVGLIATALLVATPLAHRALTGRRQPADRQMSVAVSLTGVVAVLSFTIEAGVVAAVMTLPWLGTGTMLLLTALRTTGLGILMRRPKTAVLGPFATWAWMAAGGCWLTSHRLGIEPLGFDRAITLLTVAHFHVAGLGLTALLTVTYRRRPARSLLGALWLHQAGMLAVAAGLTFNDHLEVAGATMITAALSIWAVAVVRWLWDGLPGPARTILAVSAVAWVLPMALALGWALGPFLPEPIVATFETMLRFHAVLQTFGLVLCGLAGLILAEPAEALTPATDPIIDTPELEAHHAVVQPPHR